MKLVQSTIDRNVSSTGSIECICIRTSSTSKNKQTKTSMKLPFLRDETNRNQMHSHSFWNLSSPFTPLFNSHRHHSLGGQCWDIQRRPFSRLLPSFSPEVLIVPSPSQGCFSPQKDQFFTYLCCLLTHFQSHFSQVFECLLYLTKRKFLEKWHTG